MKRMLAVTLLLGTTLAAARADDCPGGAEDNKLWFDRPAAHWNEALPLGNGRLGAMVFGGPEQERFQLNEESLWAGCPTEAWPEDYFQHVQEVRRLLLAGRNHDADQYGLKHLTARPTSFRSYEPLADLRIAFVSHTNFTAYRRELDLATGVARVTFKRGDVTLTREAFISATDDVLAIRLTTDQPGALDFSVSLDRARNAAIHARGHDRLLLDGQIIDVEAKDGGYDDNPGGSGPGGAHMKFAGRLLARTDQGRVSAQGGRLQVQGANEVLLLFTAATDYNPSKMNFDRRLEPARTAERILHRAAAKAWPQLLESHLNEYRPKFGRVSLRLDPDVPDRNALPTDARLEAIRAGGDDPGLAALHFQFGRYLLMSSSRRPGRLPANLQGLWNDKLWAPWESDYHLNINLQMNYWPARVANLPETAGPLLDWLERLARRGRVAARRLYAADGWTAFLATNPFGRVSPSASTLESQFLNASLDPLCGAWLAAELFDHYQFTGERAFLRRLWPILEGASEFILDTLIVGPDGRLVVAPSTSPENSYVDPASGKRLRITLGSTYHASIVRAVFDATDRAGAILGTGAKLRRRIADARGQLPPLQLGPDGRILEWSSPLVEDEPGHRHVSHLIGLYPFDFISPKTPDWMTGARRSLEFRLRHGSGNYGWSRAWMINFFARLQDGEAAREHYLALLKQSTSPGLLNVSSFFQIDGNFGATAGLCEMLVQSHERMAAAGPADQKFVLELLPALPEAWADGAAKGLCARGGYIVDMDWKNSKVARAVIHSKNDGECQVRWSGKTIELKTRRGQSYPLPAGS